MAATRSEDYLMSLYCQLNVLLSLSQEVFVLFCHLLLTLTLTLTLTLSGPHSPAASFTAVLWQ